MEHTSCMPQEQPADGYWAADAGPQCMCDHTVQSSTTHCLVNITSPQYTVRCSQACCVRT